MMCANESIGSYVSKLMLFPNLAYRSTFNDSISSRTELNFSSMLDTDSSILDVDVARSFWTSGSGREMKESPIL